MAEERKKNPDEAARDALTAGVAPETHETPVQDGVQENLESREHASGLPEDEKAAKRKRVWVAVAVAAVLAVAIGVAGLSGAFRGLTGGGLFSTVESGAADGTAASQEQIAFGGRDSQKTDAQSADPDAPVSSDADGSAAGASGAAAGDAASHQGSGASDGSASAGSASSGSSGESSGSAGGSSSGGGTAPAPRPEPEPAPEPAPQPAPATVTVTVSVDSSSVGSPVSWSSAVTLNQGATVYDALAASGIGFNAESSAYGIYISSIGGLAEKEHGSGSGWKYFVNGAFVPVACSACVLNDGDYIAWTYVTS